LVGCTNTKREKSFKIFVLESREAESRWPSAELLLLGSENDWFVSWEIEMNLFRLEMFLNGSYDRSIFMHLHSAYVE
jgi:hypothetical protein